MKIKALTSRISSLLALASRPSLFIAAAALVPLLTPQPAKAGAYIMSASDGFGATSFNAIGKWVTNPGGVAATGAPSAGNTYTTGAFVLRTPTASNSFTFGGDSLSVDPTGVLLGKATTITLNFTNGTGLFLNGGLLRSGNAANSVMTVAGTITANDSTTSFLSAQGNETLNVTGSIGGSGNLTINGKVDNVTFTDIGVVKLSGTNTINGTVTVTAPNGTIASATNRQLQLNNANALQNATLSLTANATQANFVSFTNVASTYNIGALAGGANQTLTDTAGAAITLSVGSNGASTSYSGVLSGNGSLTKTGSGALTLNGTNTYTGATLVSAGTLILSGSGSVNSSSSVTVSTGATLTNDVAALTTALGLGEGATLLGSSLFTPSALTITGDLTGGTFTPVTLSTSLTKTGALAFTLTNVVANDYSLFTGTTPSGSFASVSVGGTPLIDQSGGIFSAEVGGFTYTYDDNLNTLGIAAIPEPATWALAALGLTFLLYRRRFARLLRGCRDHA